MKCSLSKKIAMDRWLDIPAIEIEGTEFLKNSKEAEQTLFDLNGIILLYMLAYDICEFQPYINEQAYAAMTGFLMVGKGNFYLGAVRDDNYKQYSWVEVIYVTENKNSYPVITGKVKEDGAISLSLSFPKIKI